MSLLVKTTEAFNYTIDGTVPRVNIYGGPLGVTFLINLGIALLLFLVFLIVLERFTFYNSFRKKRLYLTVLNLTYPQSDVEKAEAKPTFKERAKHYFSHRLNFYKTIILSLLTKETRRMILERIVKLYGRGIATYFLFLQYNLYAILGITLFSFIILLPIHVRFSITDPQYITQTVGQTVWSDVPILYTSIVSTHNEPWILAFHLIYACLVILLGIFLALKFLMHPLVQQYNYCGCDEEVSTEGLLVKRGRAHIVEYTRKENQSIRQYTSPYSINFAGLFSPTTVEVRGLPPTFVSQKLFHVIVSRLVKNPQDIIKTTLLMDYTPFLKYKSQVQKYENELERYSLYTTKTGFRSGIDVRKENGQIESVDAIDYLKAKLWNSQLRMQNVGMQIDQAKMIDYTIQESEDPRILLATQPFPPCFDSKKEKRIQGSGFGYIIFKNESCAKEFINTVSLYGLLVKFYTENDTTLLIRMIQQPFSHKKRYLLPKRLVYHPIHHGRFLHVSRVEAEPQDINWNRLFSYYNYGMIVPVITRVVVSVATIIIIAIFCVSLTMASGLQLAVVNLFLSEQSPNSSQVFGSFLFNYLPTFFLFLCVLILPFVVERSTIQFAHYKSFSKPRHVILQLIYGGLLLNVLILPTLGLIAMNGVGDYFTNSRLNETVSRIYFPTSGAFFISLLLQFALLKNIGDLLRPIDLLEYIFTCCKWRLTKGLLTMREWLQLAELSDFRVEKEYGFLLSVFAIALCYSVFSPIAALCGSLYFVLKYVVDCYSLLYVYGHYGHLHRENGTRIHHYGSLIGFKSNFVSHHRYCKLLFRAFVVNLILFTIFLIAYFASRIQYNNHFAIHTMFSIILCAFCLVFVVVAERIFDFQFYKNVLPEISAKTMQKNEQVDWDKLYEFPHKKRDDDSPMANA